MGILHFLMRDELSPEARRALRARRERRRKMYRRRRLVALGILIAIVAAIAATVATLAGGSSEPRTAAGPSRHPKPAKPKETPRPKEIRGVHVTMSLAALNGKIDDYLALRRHGLNTLEVDVKDESGEVGFVSPEVKLAQRIGAAHPYYNPFEVAAKAHAKHVYLIGRVVVFEDPVLAEKRPSYAIENPDGSVWHNNIGLGWTNMYDKRVWEYNVDVGKAAARAGFDEIQFDYVRFPSDGDVSIIQYPGKIDEKMGVTIGRFAQYAAAKLHPLGVRVGADLFGLAANHNLGIGQVPRKIGRYLDTISPMAYPSHYGPGEYNIPDPNADPGSIVFRTLKDFRRALRGRKAQIVPWLQDFSLGKTYTFEDVAAQVDAARRAEARGFLLWNPEGLYTAKALRPAPKTSYGASLSTTQSGSNR
jgi:hypothetical protein